MVCKVRWTAVAIGLSLIVPSAGLAQGPAAAEEYLEALGRFDAELVELVGKAEQQTVELRALISAGLANLDFKLLSDAAFDGFAQKALTNSAQVTFLLRLHSLTVGWGDDQAQRDQVLASIDVALSFIENDLRTWQGLEDVLEEAEVFVPRAQRELRDALLSDMASLSDILREARAFIEG
jgi:hypothetical protein